MSLRGTACPVSCDELASTVSAALTELNVSQNSIGNEASKLCSGSRLALCN